MVNTAILKEWMERAGHCNINRTSTFGGKENVERGVKPYTGCDMGDVRGRNLRITFLDVCKSENLENRTSSENNVALVKNCTEVIKKKIDYA